MISKLIALVQTELYNTFPGCKIARFLDDNKVNLLPLKNKFGYFNYLSNAIIEDLFSEASEKKKIKTFFVFSQDHIIDKQAKKGFHYVLDVFGDSIFRDVKIYDAFIKNYKNIVYIPNYLHYMKNKFGIEQGSILESIKREQKKINKSENTQFSENIKNQKRNFVKYLNEKIPRKQIQLVEKIQK